LLIQSPGLNARPLKPSRCDESCGTGVAGSVDRQVEKLGRATKDVSEGVELVNIGIAPIPPRDLRTIGQKPPDPKRDFVVTIDSGDLAERKAGHVSLAILGGAHGEC